MQLLNSLLMDRILDCELAVGNKADKARQEQERKGGEDLMRYGSKRSCATAER